MLLMIKIVFDHIPNWFNKVKNRNQTAIFFLVGNKTDLKGSKASIYRRSKKYAKDNNMKFFEVSAKIKDNINNIFNSIIPEILRHRKKINNSKDYNYNDISCCDKCCNCFHYMKKSEEEN